MNVEVDTNLSPTPNDPRDDLAAFGIGAADRDESLAVKQLISEHPELRQEAAEYAAAAALLTALVPRVEPPAALKTKLLAAARASRPAAPPLTVLPKPDISLARRTASPRILVWVATTAAVVLLGLNVYWMTQITQMRDAQTANSLANANFDKAVALLTAPDIQRSELMDTADASAARAMIVWTPDQRQALMVAHTLPPAGDDKTYQLWMIPADGQPMSAGIFDTGADGEPSMMFFETPIGWDGVAAMGISLEPAGGSEQPTTVVAVAEM